MREPVQTPENASSPDTPPKGAPDHPGDARPGQGLTQSSKNGAPGPRLPYEQDESAHEQQPSANTSTAEGKQAHADVVSGQQDTSYSPATDAAYHAQVTPGTTSPPPKRTR